MDNESNFIQLMNPEVIPELAPCGIWCGACPSFNKTCLGCASRDHNQDRTSKWHCRIRVCCHEREKKDYCMDCLQFPCTIHKKKLLQSHRGDPRFKYRHEIPENFRMLVELGPEIYIEYQKERYSCSDCGGRVYFYHNKCSICGKQV